MKKLRNIILMFGALTMIICWLNQININSDDTGLTLAFLDNELNNGVMFCGSDNVDLSDDMETSDGDTTDEEVAEDINFPEIETAADALNEVFWLESDLDDGVETDIPENPDTGMLVVYLLVIICFVSIGLVFIFGKRFNTDLKKNNQQKREFGKDE